MSFFSEIRNYFTPKKEVRSTEPIYDYYPDTLGDALLFGKIKTSNLAQNLSAVFRAVDLISDGIAMLPIQVKNTDKSHIQTIDGHSLNLVFSDGSNVMTRYQFMKNLISDVLLKGNGFAMIEREKNGQVTGLRYVQPNDVQIHYNERVLDKGKRLYYTTTLSTKKIEPINMIHLLKWSKDGVQGLSALMFADRTLKLSQASENSALSLYDNNCNVNGVITVQGQVTREQRQQIKKAWNESVGQYGNGIAVLQGNMEYQPISLNSKDSQLLESRLFQVEEIARFFGINPILLGDLKYASYNTIEAAQQEFILHTLMPFIYIVQEEFTRKLFRPSEANKYAIGLDTSVLLKADKNAMATYYKSMLSAGVYCINEVRLELGLPEIEGGDKHVIPYTKIEDNTFNAATEEKEENEVEEGEGEEK